ncbi:hypothetical protein V6N13_020759 [Hibiscus sabdariffa]
MVHPVCALKLDYDAAASLTRRLGKFGINIRRTALPEFPSLVPFAFEYVISMNNDRALFLFYCKHSAELYK